MEPLAITGFGAVTSVGRDATTSCAAIRAGLVRPAPLAGMTVLDLESYEEQPVVGHSAGPLTDGFSNVGRWLQLLPVALEDLCTTAGFPLPSDDPGFWQATAADVVIPALGERFLPDPTCDEAAMTSALATPLLQRTRDYFAPQTLEVHAKGRIGVLECVQSAQERVARKECERVIIAVVDSLVDRPALQWLAENRRLKSDANPVGLSPGEAACAFALGPAKAARTGKHGVIRPIAISMGAEPRAPDGERSTSGIAMANVLSAAVSAAKLGAPFRGPLVTDLNGETWRAQELGAAWTRIDRSLVDTDAVRTPIVSTGDAGSANCGVALAVAFASLARGYARSSHVLISASDDDGRVGAVLIAQEG